MSTAFHVLKQDEEWIVENDTHLILRRPSKLEAVRLARTIAVGIADSRVVVSSEDGGVEVEYADAGTGSPREPESAAPSRRSVGR